MIEINNLYKEFEKNNPVLKQCSLKINNGTIMGIIGINGSGKSTLFRLLAGVYYPNDGEVLVDNETIYNNPAVKKKMFYLPDDPYYDQNVTPKDILNLYSCFYDLDERVYLEYLRVFKIELKGKMNTFSKGMRRQVFVSLAVACKPKYLLLDESFDGLDPLSRHIFKKAIIDLNIEVGTTVIVASHSLREIEDICDSFGIIDNKKIVLSGDITDEVNKLYKYQLVFDRSVVKSDFSDFEVLSFQTNGRVIEVVLRGELIQIEDTISKLKPLVKDQLTISLEELFLYEVNKEGK